jgi:aerobic-type carbon monoxide dehydrogenase small subunit (CoxS/CutS family)
VTCASNRPSASGSGFILIATQLPDRHPEPADQQILHYPSGNLCRCGAILKSSRRQKLAAQKRKAGAALAGDKP